MCGAKETRTPDLFNAIEALYQLSYSPFRREQRYNNFSTYAKRSDITWSSNILNRVTNACLLKGSQP